MVRYCGEFITYKASYGIFHIGDGSISFSDVQEGNIGHIKAETYSSGWIRIFNDLNYRYESYMNLSSGLPNTAIRSLEDRKNNLFNILTFDHTSRSDSAIIISLMSGKHMVPKNIFDILTGFFHFRTYYLTDSTLLGEEVIIKTFFTDELWDLRIRYAGEETINTIFGSVNCYKYNTVTVVGRFFQHEDDLSIWFTKDKNLVPVKLSANLKIGKLDFECVEYQNPGNKP